MLSELSVVAHLIDFLWPTFSEPRSYLEHPPISWIFSLFGITQAKQSLAKVRGKMAQKWGFDHNLWSSIEAGEGAARAYFKTWNEQVMAKVPKGIHFFKLERQAGQTVTQTYEMTVGQTERQTNR